MNCKQGDLAVIIAGNDDNVGKIVEVVRPWPHNDPMDEFSWSVRVCGNGWLSNWCGQPRKQLGAYDRDLRPIRGDSQHTDEPERIKVEA